MSKESFFFFRSLFLYTITTLRFPEIPTKNDLGLLAYLYESFRRDLKNANLVDPDKTRDYFQQQAERLYEQTDGVIKIEFVPYTR